VKAELNQKRQQLANMQKTLEGFQAKVLPISRQSPGVSSSRRDPIGWPTTTCVIALNHAVAVDGIDFPKKKGERWKTRRL
jgi:hypothetical protein